MTTQTDKAAPPAEQHRQGAPETEPPTEPTPPAGSVDESKLRCTLCGLRVCWTK